jgi:putative DNA primase/helicase
MQTVEFSKGHEMPPCWDLGSARGGNDIEDRALPWLNPPKPAALGDDLPPVAAFNSALLPVAVRALVDDVSERMQAPPDFAAAAAVLALAGAVNRRAVIEPKLHDASWHIVPNLWGAMVGPPGVMKSPVVSAIMRPLERLESESRSAFDTERGDYEAAKEANDIEVSAWKDDFKKAVRKGNDRPARPEFAQTEPTPRRLITNDATFEALHTVLAQNPAGLLLLRDELTGWLAGLERQGREGERAFFLEAWNGDKPFTVDRIGRGSVYVPATCISLFGGIQPGRLRSYLADALKDGPSNDGLIQRLQIVVWPDVTKNWRLVDRPPDPRAEDAVARVLQKLAALEPDPTRVVKFSADAQELFYVWWEELESKLRCGDSHPAMQAHLAKYRKLMPALALLFELADWGSGNGEFPQAVSLDHARQAAACCEYFESHAARMYACITSPDVRAARNLADKIARRDLGEVFSVRDVYLKGWTGLGTAEEVRRALDILVDAGWVREAPEVLNSGGGRPSERYQLNPRLHSE